MSTGVRIAPAGIGLIVAGIGLAYLGSRDSHHLAEEAERARRARPPHNLVRLGGLRRHGGLHDLKSSQLRLSRVKTLRKAAFRSRGIDLV